MVVIRRELPRTYRASPGRSPVAKRGRGSSFPRAARTLAALLQHVLYAARSGREASCLSTSTPTAQTKPESSRATAVIASCFGRFDRLLWIWLSTPFAG